MIPIGKSDIPLSILPQMANRHGLIAGATGTGKTMTLRVLAEGFSRLGVPVFMADIKGDLSGLRRHNTTPIHRNAITPMAVQAQGAHLIRANRKACRKRSWAPWPAVPPPALVRKSAGN